jgi:DNA-binding MarR family transcriptional regulator
LTITKYIKFKVLMVAINDKYEIEPIHVRILDYVTNANFNKTPISVSDIIARREIASPATIHMRLKQLVCLGLLDMNQSSDQRKKFLTITEKTHARMSEICELLNENFEELEILDIKQ